MVWSEEKVWTGIDRTSNREWKRRRNRVLVLRSLLHMNYTCDCTECRLKSGQQIIVDRVMETRPGLDRKKVEKMVSELFSEKE